MGAMEHAAEHVAPDLIDTHRMLKAHARNRWSGADLCCSIRGDEGADGSDCNVCDEKSEPDLEIAGCRSPEVSRL
jgi:hypothetical protein